MVLMQLQWMKTYHICCSKLITSHCSFISEAVEGTAAQLAGTVTFNSNNLNLSDYYSVVGPRCKGYILGKDELMT